MSRVSIIRTLGASCVASAATCAATGGSGSMRSSSAVPIFKMQRVMRGDVCYADKTREMVRMDMHDLERPVHKQLVHAARQWVEGCLYAGGLCVHRWHWQKRLDAYHLAPSRSGAYLELLTPEWLLLRNINQWLRSGRPSFELVEVGWNAWDLVCKVSVVIQLPETRRFLFLCIGADAGVKTFYITPTFKYRKAYQSSQPDIGMTDHVPGQNTPPTTGAPVVAVAIDETSLPSLDSLTVAITDIEATETETASKITDQTSESK